MLFVVVLFFKQKTAYEVRISDWSSDVCSSDLDLFRRQMIEPDRRHPLDAEFSCRLQNPRVRDHSIIGINEDRRDEVELDEADRKSVVSGTRVSVRVDLGGRRIINKKRLYENQSHSTTTQKDTL